MKGVQTGSVSRDAGLKVMSYINIINSLLQVLKQETKQNPTLYIEKYVRDSNFARGCLILDNTEDRVNIAIQLSIGGGGYWVCSIRFYEKQNLDEIRRDLVARWGSVPFVPNIMEGIPLGGSNINPERRSSEKEFKGTCYTGIIEDRAKLPLVLSCFTNKSESRVLEKAVDQALGFKGPPPSDRRTFAGLIRSLLKANLIVKVSGGFYTLTDYGLKKLNPVDRPAEVASQKIAVDEPAVSVGVKSIQTISEERRAFLLESLKSTGELKTKTDHNILGLQKLSNQLGGIIAELERELGLPK